MKVVILCGGRGTRIRDVADDIPKPLIRIGDKPILWHIMMRYAKYGISDFVLTLGYKGWLIKEFFLNYRYIVSDITLSLARNGQVAVHDLYPERDWRVTLAETGIETQTAGRLWRVREYLKDEELFSLTYGDGVSDIDIAALVQFHQKHGKIGTVTGVRPAGRFGVLEISREGAVPVAKRFSEKPQSLEGNINGGFFVFDQRLWDYVSSDPNMPFEQEPLQRLAAEGELAVYEHDGFWQAMDTFRDWKLLNSLWDSGSPPWMS